MKYNVNNPVILHNTPTLEDLDFKENQAENNALKARLKMKVLKQQLLELQTLALEKNSNIIYNPLKS